ncbi:squalene epoxidase-domain-containing protein [Ephemerocybe angulata]|uniref:Squalene monooxygenase n=1 Tax=Ephemerocybe angulata TaxID=980116 RepID=A0A8H6LZ37_9AGAR|nr:squalene epoxidase-domain-containing protein [Tulosesus angulatus]
MFEKLNHPLIAMPLPSFDVVIVGAGVAGSAMAHALATIPRLNLIRVALIELLEKAAIQPKIFSYTIAAVLKDATPPLPGHGTLVLPRGLPAIAMYQLTDTETRMLIDIKEPLPEDIPDYIFNRLVPELPLSLQKPVIEAFKTDRIRKMPNRFLPAVKQGTKASKTGVILLGDSWNMRHPITGVGMSVALRDVVYLRKAFCNFESFENWDSRPAHPPEERCTPRCP